MKDLRIFISTLSVGELEVLQKIVGASSLNIDKILVRFYKLRLSIIKSRLFRFNKNNSYDDIIDYIGENRQISLTTIGSINRERELFQKLFIADYENMDINEKKEFEKELLKNGLNKKQIYSITSLVAITGAKASGFGIYLLASTTASTISSIFGFTLPFVFYTIMSTVISYSIGSIGFLFVGYNIYIKFKDLSLSEIKSLFIQSKTNIKSSILGNDERTEIAFKYISSLRLIKAKRIEDKIFKLNLNKEHITQEIERFKNELNRLLIKK